MNFPIELRFKLLAIASQISVTDATGRVVSYVKQKAFKLRESVTIFSDESQSHPLYHIAADRVIDFSAQYHITEAAGQPLGTVQRRGMRSLWRAHYEILAANGSAFTVRETNPWVRVLDGILGDVPILGMFTGYVFNPTYEVTRADGGTAVLRVVKQRAFLEGRFRIERVGTLSPSEEPLVVLGVLMMLLLERQRG